MYASTVRAAGLVICAMLAACGERPVPRGDETAPVPPPAAPVDAAPVTVVAPDAAPVTTVAVDAAPAPVTACVADDEHCCLPDGSLVVPGGCQPSYPDHVQPATRRGPDGRCVQIECYKKCLPETTRIATPRGEIAVTELAVGDPVWSVDATGARIATRILRVSSEPLDAPHAIVELTLADGRTARASGGHPTWDGVRLDRLAPGDTLDGAVITGARTLPYDGARTWDLLPGGPTGAYWADGVLLGSTLR